MLVELQGNLLGTLKNKPLLVVPVNTVGVAGKGLACWMRMRYPDAFNHYRKICRRGNMTAAEMTVCETKDGLLAMFPTKYHWANPSDVELIRQSANRLKEYMESKNIELVCMPHVGCGKQTGQLDWESEVKPIFEEVFPKGCGLSVYVFTKD